MGISKITDRIILRLAEFIENKYREGKRREYVENNSYILNLGTGFKFNFRSSNLEINPGAEVNFDEDVVFRDFCSVIVHNNANLNLGKKVFFNRYSSINCLGNITIDDYTIFGEGVKLYDHNHVYKDPNQIIQDVECNIGKIIIGRNCWIGSNVIILNNVTIGDNVVIGANNLIYKNVPSNVIVKNKTESIVKGRL